MMTNEPFMIKTYPIPMAKREAARREIDRMLELGIIRRSTTPWINPAVVVNKNDNTVRFCKDARELNKHLQSDHEKMQNIDELLQRCNNIGIMSSFDLTKLILASPPTSNINTIHRIPVRG